MHEPGYILGFGDVWHRTAIHSIHLSELDLRFFRPVHASHRILIRKKKQPRFDDAARLPLRTN